jgi:UDP-N-acetylglucosamine transferase subunit ALG13
VIFVTVGSSEPFDRLIRAMDDWAGLHSRTDVFAQIGRSRFVPRHIAAVPFLDPSEFRERIRAARIVVAHAGMGSIISALEMAKPIIVMPRRGKLGETRDDHQVSTAEEFERRQAVIVAADETDLIRKLQHEASYSTCARISGEASPALISAITSFILDRRC